MPSPGEVPVSATGVIHGEVLTRSWVVDMILDLAGYTPDRDLERLRVVEPAAGTGAFVGPIVDRLLKSATSRGTKIGLSNFSDALRAFDIQEHNADLLKDLIFSKLVTADVTARTARKLATKWVVLGDYLLDPEAEHNVDVDLVVGNPPYIRMEDIPDSRSSTYRDKFRTMTGRADIYVAFFEAGLRSLKFGGNLVFICADRWMRNDYGKGLRKLITTGGFSIDAVITAHDADVFESQVDAYPAIVVLRRGKQGAAAIVDTTRHLTSSDVDALVKAVITAQHADTAAYSVGTIPSWHTSGTSGWPHGSPAVLERLVKLGELPTIEESGAKIGIGIATGADGVYVTQKGGMVPNVETDRLLPLAHADDIRSGEWNWVGRHLVNPWEFDGIIDLDSYPLMREYLTSHPSTQARSIAKRNPTSWWRTIDRVAFRLLDRPLILLQDMSQDINPVISPPGFYPHHNLYWIDVQDSAWTPEVLSGVLLSDQVREQLAARCVLMRGHTLRLQAQYLRQIRLPDPRCIPKNVATSLQCAYFNRDRALATASLRAMFR